MPHIDKVLACRDCGVSFTFTAGEQAFFASRGLLNQPSRCSGCRNARKLGHSPVGEGYTHYGPFVSFGGRTPRQMHPTICAQCNQMTEVPFLPKGDRPVYCSDCFANIKVSSEEEEGWPKRDWNVG
jgi:CxxC-x17-CxxC domain-containing protein